jgi:hypothetical protein
MARSTPATGHDDGAMAFARACFETVWSSDQTTLRWAVQLHDLVTASGTARWPEDRSDALLDHAMELLRGAESSFVPGCPRATPKGLSPAGPLGPAWRRALADIEACSTGAP